MRKMKRVLCVILAVISIFVMDIDTVSEVQAASKEKFDGYSFYIELYETTYKKAGAVIVNASDKTKNFPEYTYAERARYNGYALPPSCEKLLVLDDSIVLMGYKSDGSKEIIYGMDGYDHYGYDRNGYSRYGKKFEESNYHALSGNVAIGCILFDADTGYNFLFQYNKDNKKLTYKLTRTDSKKSQFSVDDVYDTRGHSLNREHYTIKAKAKNVDKYGHGTYAVTVQTDSYYNNAKFTKTVTVIPKQIGNFDSIEDKTDDRYIYNAQYFIPAEKYMEYKTKGIVGIEYQIGPLKGKKVTKNKKNCIVFEEGKFAKNCIKGSMKFDKKKIKTFSNATWSVKGFHLATFAKQDRHIAYEFKLRSYVLVNGKKIYSEWSKGVSMTYGNGYELKGFDGLL